MTAMSLVSLVEFQISKWAWFPVVKTVCRLAEYKSLHQLPHLRIAEHGFGWRITGAYSGYPDGTGPGSVGSPTHDKLLVDVYIDLVVMRHYGDEIRLIQTSGDSRTERV